METTKLNAQQKLILQKNIEERGLNTTLKKNVAYFEILKKQGLITEEEFLGSYDSTLLTLGR